jgi:hypothetical protein
MTILRGRSLTMVAGVVSAASLFAACGNSPGDERDRQSLLQMAESLSRADEAAAQDPCTLLSAKEAGPYVGLLAIAPFRASDGSDTPDAAGEECVYRGMDGRHLTVLADWRGGGTMGKVLEGIPKSVDGTTRGANAERRDSIAGKDLPEGPTGPWDKVTWIAGALFVYKGDAQIRIDVSAATGRESDALAMAREIVPRIGHPLFNDEARASVRAPMRNAHLGLPRDVVPIPEAFKEQMT